MAVRVADSIKQMNDNKEFPVAYGADIWLDKNKGQGNPDYKSIQGMLNDNELGGGGEQIQYEIMPAASATNLGRVVQYVGASGTYQNGFFYRCVSDEEPTPTYSWEVVELAAEVPLATTSTPGIVKPDGDTITVEPDGTIHAAPANTFKGEDFSVDAVNEVSLLPVRRVFNGTRAAWDSLSVAEKTQYGATAFTDDEAILQETPELITSQVQPGPGYSSGNIVVQKLGHLVQLDLRSVVTTGLEKVIYTGLPKPSNDEPYFVVQGDGNPHILGLGNLRADGVLWSGASTAGMAAGVVWDGTIMYFTND